MKRFTILLCCIAFILSCGCKKNVKDMVSSDLSGSTESQTPSSNSLIDERKEMGHLIEESDTVSQIELSENEFDQVNNSLSSNADGDRSIFYNDLLDNFYFLRCIGEHSKPPSELFFGNVQSAENIPQKDWVYSVDYIKDGAVYISTNETIVRYMDGQAKMMLPSSFVSTRFYTQDYIYYECEGILYRIDYDGNHIEKIFNGPSNFSQFLIIDDQVWYIDNGLGCISFDGETNIFFSGIDTFSMYMNNGWIYFVDAHTQALKRFNIRTYQLEKIAEEVSKVNFTKDYILYSKDFTVEDSPVSKSELWKMNSTENKMIMKNDNSYYDGIIVQQDKLFLTCSQLYTFYIEQIDITGKILRTFK